MVLHGNRQSRIKRAAVLPPYPANRNSQPVRATTPPALPTQWNGTVASRQWRPHLSMLVTFEKSMRSPLMACLLVAMLSLGFISSLRAETPHDPNLPTVQPEALERLSDDRIRQQIMWASQDHYGGRCVCPYMTRDTYGHSCRGRHERIKTKPVPICYPREVTDEMISNWRRQHP